MIKYFQKAIVPDNTYAEENDVSRATHFTINGGPMQPIDQLQHVKAPTVNSGDEVLDVPAWNEEEQGCPRTVDHVLDLPTYEEDEQYSKTKEHVIFNDTDGGVLDAPNYD